MDEPTPAEQLSFEVARDELEQVVQKLEDGSTSLEEALALWERGEALYRACRSRLEAAEARIEKLAEALAEPPAPADSVRRASARRSRPSAGSGGCAASCSRMCAVQPAVRAAANVDGYRSGGSSTPPSTTAA